jgi:hypothetical protein
MAQFAKLLQKAFMAEICIYKKFAILHFEKPVIVVKIGCAIYLAAHRAVISHYILESGKLNQYFL